MRGLEEKIFCFSLSQQICCILVKPQRVMLREVFNYRLNKGLLIDTYYFFQDLLSFQIGQKQYRVIVLGIDQKYKRDQLGKDPCQPQSSDCVLRATALIFTSNPIPGTICQFDSLMPLIKMILLIIVMLDSTSTSTQIRRHLPDLANLSRQMVQN